jgi:hypothetical protein
MYVFERAYADYLARIRSFARRLGETCVHVWGWFWRGRGADVIELLLRLGIVGTAVWMAVLYLQYEESQGRGFSGGTVGVLVLIVVYVGVLLWGWKAPVHLLARLFSGLVAAGAILIFGILAAAAASAAALLYLSALLSLTALSFLVFLPMRAGQEAWLLYRRIAYRCPYDDCAFSGLPIHICTCGERYPDLLPSFYGLLHHVCRHGKQDVKLPTMDLLGRSKLARLCGGCERPLIHTSIGELPEWPVAIVGGTSAGKTVFLLQAARQLRTHLQKAPGGTVRIDSEQQEREYRREVEQLDRGVVVAKTAGDVMHAFGLAVRVPKRFECLLYLFDAPGEHFATVQRFGRKQALQHLRGIVLLADPFALPGLSEHAQRLGAEVGASQMPFRDVAYNLIQNVNLLLAKRPDEKCPVPLAVVLSKADALPVQEYPFLADLLPRGSSGNGALSARCRAALDKLGEGPSLRALEQKFSRVSYFACSALGRIPAARETKPFQPLAVEQPFLWLLDHVKAR